MIVTSSLFPIRVELAVWWKSLTVFTDTDRQTDRLTTDTTPMGVTDTALYPAWLLSRPVWD